MSTKYTAALLQGRVRSMLYKASQQHRVFDVDAKRYFFLRPSSFPYCGFKKILQAPEDLELQRLTGLMSDYFTSVGTATHEVFQRYVGIEGEIVGDWYCPSCRDITLSCDVIGDCPKCKADKMTLEYRELEVRYKDTVIGHLDGLFRLEPKKGKKSPHIVIDYKTSSMSKMSKPKPPYPYAGNVAQIEMYIPLMEAEADLNIVGWALIYLARDLPLFKGQYIVARNVSAKKKEQLAKKLDLWVKTHRRVLKAKTREDIEVIRNTKLCTDKAFHDTLFTESYEKCKFAKDCFDEGKSDKLIDKVLKHKIFPILQHATADVAKGLAMEKSFLKCKGTKARTKSTKKVKR